MATATELKKQADHLRKLLAQVDKALGDEGSERARDAARKRKQRSADKEVMIPRCRDRKRRADLEDSDERWLRYYFGESCGLEVDTTFWYDFTLQQREMISAIRNAIRYGGDQALAASRGEGKTTLFERMLLKYTLAGTISFSVLFGATGGAAGDSLDSIKQAIEENEHLAADYPEVCTPVGALENTPNRAHYMLVTGYRHDNDQPYKQASAKFSWCGQEIILPNVPGSPSARAIIATRGLDSAVRGLKKKGRRPDVAGIDDPDTEETARSDDQAKKLRDRIDKGIAGLGSQQRSVARVMLTTLQSRKSVSYLYTDPKKKPTWKGKRYRFLLKEPTRLDLWQQYMDMRAEDMQQGDENARRAHAFYIDNRPAMDEGAEVANPNRFDGEVLPDGTQIEASALQHYYNAIVRTDEESVNTELNNDPPAETDEDDIGITANLVRSRVNDLPQGVVPNDASFLTAGIDVGKRACYWVVTAWKLDGSGYVVDYGTQAVHADADTDRAVERAIVAALHDWREETLADPYKDEDGKAKRVDLALVDSGFWTDAVYQFTREAGGKSGGFMPSKGFGESGDAKRSTFRMPPMKSSDKKVGDHWYESHQDKARLWLVNMDSDHWKNWLHARWITRIDSPGSLTLYKPEHRRKHIAFANHMVAEILTTEWTKNGQKRYWKKVSRNNHYLDAIYQASVAGSMFGVRLFSNQSRSRTAGNAAAAATKVGRGFARRR